MEKWKDYYGYKVSNKGRILNRFGKQVNGYIAKDRGYSYKVVVLRIDKKRVHLHLNTLVCRLFNEYYQDGARVYHRDGNIENCSIDNLKISIAYTNNATDEQISVYEKNVINCCKDYFFKQGYFNCGWRGMDIDNTLSETMFLVWKHLP